MSRPMDLSVKFERPPVAALGVDFVVPFASTATDAGGGEMLLIDRATGYASLADDETPNAISGGAVNMQENTLGSKTTTVSWGQACRRASAVANDAPTLLSVGAPIYSAGSSTVGLLSHTGTVAGGDLKNRSLWGFTLNVASDSPTPNGSARVRVWEGPVAQAVARSVLVASSYVGGSLSKAIDAGATTDLAETLCDNVSPHHGRVTSVRFIVSGTTLPASGNTDYKTLRLWKRPASGGTPVLVASATTKTTAWTQWETVTFTLSTAAGALDKLETDIFTVDETHGGSGAVIPAGKLTIDLTVGG